MITFSCECGKRYKLKDELAGKRAKCPCGRSLIVPQPTPPQSSNSLPAAAQSESQLTLPITESGSERSRHTVRLAIVMCAAALVLAAGGLGIRSLTGAKPTTKMEPVPDLPVIASAKGWEVQVRAAEFIGITNVQPPAQGKSYQYRYSLQKSSPSDFFAIVLRCIYQDPSNRMLIFPKITCSKSKKELPIVALGILGDDEYVSTDLKLSGDPLSLAPREASADLAMNRHPVEVHQMIGVGLAEKPKGSAINLIFVVKKPDEIPLSGMHLELRKIFDIEVVKVSPPS